MVCNRLEVICHEDLNKPAAPHVAPFVAVAVALSKERYSKSIGEARHIVGNCIRIMCRSRLRGLPFWRGHRASIHA